MRVVLSYRQSGHELQNVWDVITTETPATVAQAFETEYWTNNLKGELSSSLVLDTISASDGVGVPHLLPVNDAGQHAPTALPPNTGVLVTKVATGAGRPGRLFQAGILEGDADSGGFVTQTRLQSLTVAYTNAHTALNLAGIELAVRNRVPPGPPWTYVTFGLLTLVPRPLVYTMGQRIRG